MKAPFFDTTVLIAGIIDFGKAAEPAQRILSAIASRRIRRPRTAWHCCLEFYAVVTRLPEEFRLLPEEAVHLVEEEILGRFEMCDLPHSRWKEFLRSAAAARIGGGRVYDAHIAAVAAQSGATVLVTENLRDVALLPPGVMKVMGPADYVASHRAV